MKVLVVSLFLPQEKAYHAGGRYVFEVVRELSSRHEVHLVTRLEEGEVLYLAELQPLCERIYQYTYRTAAKRGLVDSAGLVANYLGFSRFANRLIRKGDFDVVFVQWVETAIMIRKGKTPMVLDAHDVITKPAERIWRQSSGVGRIAAFGKYLLVRGLEKSIARRFAVVLARSEFDRDLLLRMEPRARVAIVPHPAGLDISEREYPVRENTILFLASFKYRRLNVDGALWFYREVLPRVREKVPNARFIIAGYGPPEELTQLAAVDPQVEVTGFVDDIDRCYKEAAVFVAPILTGGGIIVKILDALAAKRPVVCTRFGNEGIGAEPGRDLLVADAPAEFAAAVVRLLTQPGVAREIAENGAEFARGRYGLEALVDTIEWAFAEAKGESHR